MDIIKTKRLLIKITDEKSTKDIQKANEFIVRENYNLTLSENEKEEVFNNLQDMSALILRLCNSVGNGEGIVYGAWFNDALIGFVALVECTEPDIREIQIEIDPNYHHQGFGYELLCSVLKEQFCKNSNLCFRYTVLPYNKASIALVEKAGGVLQKPGSSVEEMFIKTYFITKDSLHLTK